MDLRSSGVITNKFSIDYIMQIFDVEKLQILKQAFRKKEKDAGEGFSLIEFVELMKKVIPYDHPSEEVDLVHGLCALFQEIDINGNGDMEWCEFTEFLIEAVDQKQLTLAGHLKSEEIVSENAVA